MASHSISTLDFLDFQPAPPRHLLAHSVLSYQSTLCTEAFKDLMAQGCIMKWRERHRPRVSQDLRVGWVFSVAPWRSLTFV